MKYAIMVTLIVMLAHTVFGQDAKLSEEYKKEVIDQLSTLLIDFYVYPDIAQETSDYLASKYRDGHFDSCVDNQAFAFLLTESVQSINKDKHMRIMANKPYTAPENSLERKAEQRMDQINNYRNYNHGFHAVKILEGNVGYLDLRGFAGMERAKEIADAYMKLISQADAVVIDLSKNGGGDPSMVQYLCSYFFKEKKHLNSLYYREGDRTEEYWTLAEVGGKKMEDVPLFVITGKDTFSGAEEFSYNMQTQKRATLVGQTSGGGANPGGTRGINQDLAVFIPTGRAINPITNTSWEGTGVIPEVKTAEDETFDRAYALAKEAAQVLRTKKTANYIKLHKELNIHLEQYKQGESEIKVENSIRSFVDSGLFGEWDINSLGYEYLRNFSKPKIALSILKVNTELFPNSANVFDSYGEALRIDGDLVAAMASYQRALDVAVRDNSPDVDYYREALQGIEDEIKRGK